MANVGPRELRQFVVAFLDDGTIVAAGMVYDSPVASFADARDTRIAVFTDAGDTEVKTMHKVEGVRTIRLKLEVRADADPAVDGATVRAREAALQAKVDDVTEAMLEKLCVDQGFLALITIVRRLDRQSGQDVASKQLHCIVQTTLHIEVRQTYKPSLAAGVDLQTIRVETDMIDPGSGPDGDIDSTILIPGMDA